VTAIVSDITEISHAKGLHLKVGITTLKVFHWRLISINTESHSLRRFWAIENTDGMPAESQYPNS
jgi:hypothetical protein